MDTEIYEYHDTTLTEYDGGEKLGQCLRITQPYGFLELTRDEAIKVAQAMMNWLIDTKE